LAYSGVSDVFFGQQLSRIIPAIPASTEPMMTVGLQPPGGLYLGWPACSFFFHFLFYRQLWIRKARLASAASLLCTGLY